MAAFYSFDHVVDIIQPLQFLRLVRRTPSSNKYEFVDIRLNKVAAIILIWESLAAFFVLCQEIQAGNMRGIKDSVNMVALIFVSFLRVYFLRKNGHRIVHLINQLDKIFPCSEEQQQRMKFGQFIPIVARRFRILENCIYPGSLLFLIKPLYYYAVAYRSGSPLTADCFHLLTWYPFNLKQSYQWYPIPYALEFFTTILGTIYTLYWHHVFYMLLTIIIEFYKLIARLLNDLDASASKDEHTAREFDDRVRTLVHRLSILDNLCRSANDVFVTFFIVTDATAATTICFQVYTLSNDNILSNVQFIVPLMVLCLLIYEQSRLGDILEDVNGDVEFALYDHNWYDGTLGYRKLIYKLLLWRSQPCRLTFTKNLLNINLMHFLKIFKLVYQLYTFQQSF